MRWRLLGFAAFAVIVATVLLPTEKSLDVHQHINPDPGSLRQFQGMLAVSADGHLYNANDLALEQARLEQQGVDRSSAHAAIQLLVEKGINPFKIHEFTTTILNIVAIYNWQPYRAAASLAEAFTRGMEAVMQLNRDLNFLNVEQYTSIRNEFDRGSMVKAQTMAFNILSSKLEAATGSLSKRSF